MFVTVFNRLPLLVYVIKLILSFCLSYWPSYLNGVSGVGSLFSLPFLTVTYTCFSSPLFVALLFMFPFPCVGSMRDKSLRFVWNHLLYLLNATDLTLLNTLPGKHRTYRAPGNSTCEHRHILTETREKKKSSREVTRARTKCGYTKHRRRRWDSWIKGRAHYRSHKSSPLTLLALTARLRPTADYS